MYSGSGSPGLYCASSKPTRVLRATTGRTRLIRTRLMPLNSTYGITRPKHNAYDKKCLVLKWQHRNYVVFRNNLVVRMKMFPERIFVRLRYKFETTARCHREVWFKSCTRCYVHSIFSIFYILGMLVWTVFTLTTENIYSIYWTKFKAIPSPLVLSKLWFFDLLIRLAVWIISNSQKLMGIYTYQIGNPATEVVFLSW